MVLLVCRSEIVSRQLPCHFLEVPNKTEPPQVGTALFVNLSRLHHSSIQNPLSPPMHFQPGGQSAAEEHGQGLSSQY